MESSSEPQENDGIDRLSNLPDSILLHILSFLPTETTVQTITLVSQRYRYLWKDLQVFHFSYYSCDSKSFKRFSDFVNGVFTHRYRYLWKDLQDFHSYYGDKSFKRFSDFVNGVFTHRTSHHIRKMHLEVCFSHNDSFVTDSIETWIGAAIGPCLEELSLCIYGTRTVEIPSTLFINCTNLVFLSLLGGIHVNVQHSSALVLFPSLKILILLIPMGSLDALLSGCPVLQILKIIDPMSKVCVPPSKVCVPPSLKRFEFYGYGGSCPYLEINAPSLQYLTIINRGKTFNTIVGNMQNVVEAFINVFSPQGESESVNPLLHLLRALCRVKKLKLPCLTTESLFCAPVLDFPEFHYLLDLEITLPSFNANFLLKMLEKCPILQDLIVRSGKEAPPGGTWKSQSTKLPNCLVSHLTSIEIGISREFQDEVIEFAEYILLNGLVLTTMFITDNYALDLEERNYILKRLSNIPRGSAICKIEFS